MEDEKREETKAEAGPPRESFEGIEAEARATKERPKKKKRRVGRPTIDEQKTKEAEEQVEREAQLAMDTKAVQGMLEWFFGSYLVPRFGPHWKLKPDEAEAGGQAWGAVFEKYAPAANRWIEEIRAATWTVGTIGPRWDLTKSIMAKQAAKAAAEAGGESGLSAP